MEEYVDQFAVIGKDILDTNTTSQMLYSAHIQRFRVQYTDEEYQLLKVYQMRIYKLIESIYENDNLLPVLNYIYTNNPTLVDIIIMQWVTPPPIHRSKIIYNNVYMKNMNMYHQRLLSIIDEKVIDQFIVETLSGNRNVPVHCIDLLWNTMQQFTISLFFINSELGDYIELTRPSDTELTVQLSLTLTFKRGLGNVPNDKGITFKDFVVHSLKNHIDEMINVDTTGNLKKQLTEIRNNPSAYGFTNFI